MDPSRFTGTRLELFQSNYLAETLFVGKSPRLLVALVVVQKLNARHSDARLVTFASSPLKLVDLYGVLAVITATAAAASTGATNRRVLSLPSSSWGLPGGRIVRCQALFEIQIRLP